MNYPFASLPENLASFCSLLRRDYQFRIGPRELMDAARGLEITDLGNERAVRDALRIILSKTYDDVLKFDAAFDRFFRGADLMRRPDWIDGMDGVAEGPADTKTGASETKPSSRGVSEGEVPATAGVSSVVRELDQSREEASATWLRASYSPLEGEGTPLVLEPPTPPWIAAARALVRRVHTAASRRWQPAPRGPRFDFRRTLRTSLRTAGEPVVPRWRAHPRRRARFVLLIDGSRSMGPSAGPPLELAVALSAVSPSTETFAFSTELRRTTIGRCLEDFLQRFGERLLGLGTVVIIASDGLDVGDTDTLRQAMERLARRSAAVIWINPLLQTPGYQPAAIGMNMVRPHVAVLTSVADAAGVRALAGRVRIS
jgi:uncharacterized protein with von Willebrand factor type A (vWA) domain